MQRLDNSIISGLMRRSNLFDHLVGALLEQRRHVQAERFRSLEIDDKLVFGWRLDHAGQFDERNLCLFRPRQSGAGSAFRPIGAASARY